MTTSTAFDATAPRPDDPRQVEAPPVMASWNDAFWKLAATAERPELGPGPRTGVLDRPDLESRLAQLASAQPLPSEIGLRLRATALLYHDHHDAAHDLVQDLSDRDGALIHAILHRREPDYWNAKYWFRRIDVHPVYLALGRRLATLPAPPNGEPLVRDLTLPGAFDPFAFVDLCEQVERSPAEAPIVRWLREVQQAEFEELVTHLASQ